jgi:hypothetical protein
VTDERILWGDSLNHLGESGDEDLGDVAEDDDETGYLTG